MERAIIKSKPLFALLMVESNTSEVLDLHGSKIFSKIGLRSGHRQIRIKEGDEWKTIYSTRYWLHERLIMPLGGS